MSRKSKDLCIIATWILTSLAVIMLLRGGLTPYQILAACIVLQVSTGVSAILLWENKL